MKPLLFKIHSRRATDETPAMADDNLGRGMEMAITVFAFLGLGYLIDRWLGLFPLFTIALVLFAAVGMFVRMKYTYDATMQRLEAERLARQASRRLEDIA